MFDCRSRNAKTYNPPDNIVNRAADKLWRLFGVAIKEFKVKELQAAKKSYGRAQSKPNSSVAALIEKRSRDCFMQSLVASSGTLLVVPWVLMQHWEVRALSPG